MKLSEKLTLALIGKDQSELLKLATDSDIEIRLEVARNRSISPAVESLLLRDISALVRIHLASNPVISPKTVKALTSDSNSEVRLVVASHDDITEIDLRRLAGDSDEEVADVAISRLMGASELLENDSVEEHAFH